MKRVSVAVLVVCSVQVAVAKPLPAGMKVELAAAKDIGHTIVVSQRGVSFTVEDAPTPMLEKLLRAELSDDGASLVIRVQRCWGGENFEDFEAKLPLASVDAKIENLLGMQLHTKKKYADAIAHFTIAAQKAPDVALYATNLLSAQAMAGKLDDADRTIATYAPRNLPWFAWRLAVDPELKAIAKRPSAKLGPAKPGTATSKLNAEFTHTAHGAVAYSPLGIVASEIETPFDYGGMPGPSSYVIVFVDIKTSAELLRLDTQTDCGPMGEGMPEHTACLKKSDAAAKRTRAVADQILRELGFTIVAADEYHALDGKPLVAKDGRVVDLGDHPHVKRGGQDRPITVPEKAQLADHVWFVPGGLVFEARSMKEIYSCSGDGTISHYVSTVPTP
jgi:hypothetical protein